MDTLYPESPAAIPKDMTQPSKTYKQRAWLAGLCLAGFILTYLFLAVWFTATAWRLIHDAVISGGGNFSNWLVGGGSAFLAVFMVKALFFIKRGNQSGLHELKPDDQPQLFEFIYRLADETGAPRPAHIYLSGSVNAAVFYDLSIFNLLLPSRKNLEIGLPLMNVLTLSEFKAVLAHEFGHFAQRSMAIGSWVYIAQQIAIHIIHRRDALDRLLAGLSNIDFRVAWIGWVLRLIVWSIRSLMDSLLRLVILAQRALSRQMEFQADLVAVSLTGSEEIVNALHKLQAADNAWARTLTFAANQLAQGRRVTDLLAVQTRIIETIGRILNDPTYGKTPVPDTSGRVFKSSFAQPPQMWSTHPSSPDREDNAKRTYIEARRDERSACLLLKDLEKIEHLIAGELITAPDQEEIKVSSTEETLKALDERFNLKQYAPRYRGSFLGRSLTRHATSPDALMGPRPDVPVADLPQALNLLYPEALSDDLDKLRDLDEEHLCLKALQSKTFKTKDNRLIFRGREISRGDLPSVIEQVRQEAEAVRQRILEHDQRCRSLHLAAAEQLGHGWPEYLRGLLGILHFAEHSEADLRDAQGVLANVYAVVTADGKVSQKEIKRLVVAANALHAVLNQLHEQRSAITLDSQLLERLQVASWDEMLGDLKFPEASAETIGSWLQAVDSWVNAAANACSALASASLEELLSTEDHIASALVSQETVAPAPAPSGVATSYATLLPGNERKRQTQLGWWDRFQIADGPLFTTIRLVGAGAIVIAVLGFGGSTSQETDISVHNGLNRPVRVSIGQHTAEIPPYGSTNLSVSLDENAQCSASTMTGEEIERFTPEIQGHSRHYVYNIAGATPLIEWTATYGNATEVPPRIVGAPRWLAANADVYFSDPPNSVTTKSGGATRKVLSGPSIGTDPKSQLSVLTDNQERQRIAQAHVRWDTPDAVQTRLWRELLH